MILYTRIRNPSSRFIPYSRSVGSSDIVELDSSDILNLGSSDIVELDSSDILNLGSFDIVELDSSDIFDLPVDRLYAVFFEKGVALAEMSASEKSPVCR